MERYPLCDSPLSASDHSFVMGFALYCIALCSERGAASYLERKKLLFGHDNVQVYFMNCLARWDGWLGRIIFSLRTCINGCIKEFLEYMGNN